MSCSVRSFVTAGMVAVTASAIAAATVPAPPAEAITSQMTRLSATFEPLIDSADAAGLVAGLVRTPAIPGPNSIVSDAVISRAAATTNNAASDFVISAWNFADYWINYGADLTQYVLGWVWPLSLIGDQAPILWDNLGSPIGDAAVYGLIAPVLNDPLNLAVWGNGLSVVARTTVTALVNTGIAEFNYFVGWLIPPLPPLPIPPLPGLAAQAAVASPLAVAEASAPVPATIAPADEATRHFAPRLKFAKAAADEAANSARGLIADAGHTITGVTTTMADAVKSVASSSRTLTKSGVPLSAVRAVHSSPRSLATNGATLGAVRSALADAVTAGKGVDSARSGVRSGLRRAFASHTKPAEATQTGRE